VILDEDQVRNPLSLRHPSAARPRTLSAGTVRRVLAAVEVALGDHHGVIRAVNLACAEQAAHFVRYRKEDRELQLLCRWQGCAPLFAGEPVTMTTNEHSGATPGR
jgi:hypothetical protein